MSQMMLQMRLMILELLLAVILELQIMKEVSQMMLQMRLMILELLLA
eukprot:gene31757-41220_t